MRIPTDVAPAFAPLSGLSQETIAIGTPSARPSPPRDLPGNRPEEPHQ